MRMKPVLSTLLLLAVLAGPVVAKKAVPSDSPLPEDVLKAVTRAGKSMKSGKYDKAAQQVQELLAGCNDVPKCLALAQATEAYGHPMLETRRACLNKAMPLCLTREDTILVALKSRQYQFFEVTRQAVHNLIGGAKTVPDLYDLARKAHEVALNDVAHMAMEKAYTGVKDDVGAFAYAEQCKALGMDDLVRKTFKDLIDDDDKPGSLCDTIIRMGGYDLRDMTRYGLRKAMDHASTVADMQDIFETARRLNEYDVANRAQYFVRKGQLIQKIKEDRAAYQIQKQEWKEGNMINAAEARERAKAQHLQSVGSGGTPGVSGSQERSKPEEPPTSGF